MDAVALQLTFGIPGFAFAVQARRTRGDRSLLWLAASCLTMSIYMCVSTALACAAGGWLGFLIATPLWTVGIAAAYVAWVLFDTWRKRRRRSPGRLHGWVVRVVESRLRLMPTPA